ncbi:MAG: hypothetical protein A4E53_04649 [Pelotomaculum sp. PtaB.Bin104]|nr:MAG: hypothetical protein A4E53_04649 [Pelotomaculum sp. PtaB.Bin104]
MQPLLTSSPQSKACRHTPAGEAASVEGSIEPRASIKIRLTSPVAVLGETDDAPPRGAEVADNPRPGRVLRADWDAPVLNPNTRQVTPSWGAPTTWHREWNVTKRDANQDYVA